MVEKTTIIEMVEKTTIILRTGPTIET